MGYLEFAHDRLQYPFSGQFYKFLPNGRENQNTQFNYNVVSNRERHYQRLFSNLLNKSGATVTIRSHDDLGWSVDTFCKLQDGNLYRVTEVQTDYGDEVDKLIYMDFNDSTETEYVARLIQIENPWGL